eukprot:6193125-Pleurochrysis_carterae.AAC.1
MSMHHDTTFVTTVIFVAILATTIITQPQLISLSSLTTSAASWRTCRIAAKPRHSTLPCSLPRQNAPQDSTQMKSSDHKGTKGRAAPPSTQTDGVRHVRRCG